MDCQRQFHLEQYFSLDSAFFSSSHTSTWLLSQLGDLIDTTQLVGSHLCSYASALVIAVAEHHIVRPSVFTCPP